MVGEVIGAIVLGVIAGYLGRALVPGKQDIGFLLTVALGIGGALVGYFLFTELLGIGDDDKFDLGGLIGAVIGAVILLVIYIKVIAPRTGGSPAPVSAPADREGRQRDRDRERDQHGGGPGDGGGGGHGGGGREGGGRGGGGGGRGRPDRERD